jgi:outer membrane protein OmpA-like peptidoglycan-associated protein
MTDRYDDYVSLLGGVTFKLGKTDWEVCTPMDYGLINDLNSRINDLRRQNEELSRRPVSCPECPPAPAPVVRTEARLVPNVVVFRINSSTIDANQQVNIYNTANFVRETGQRIKVVGYADRDTGTSQFNMALSQRRAQAVARELTTRYNVPSDRITIEYRGSNEQPFQTNNWNRVVIMTAE